MIRLSSIVLCAAAGLSAVVLAHDGPTSVRRATKRFDKRVVVSGLANPWELTWGPDGWLWVTERTGLRVLRVHPDTGERQVALALDGVATAAGPGGVLGLALHPDLLRGTGHDEVHVVYTYLDRDLPPDPRVADPDSPFRHLRATLVRFRFDATSGTLVDPVPLLRGLPAGNDHAGLRLRQAADGMLHLTLGDRGGNQLGNFCHPVRSQRLPTHDEVARQDWSAYEGKTLRIAPDGSIPPDNPSLDGVVSHVFTYGHRNPQGLAAGRGGTLYTTDHGPKTDDEVNVLAAGGNYGWPHVAGYRDDQAYEFARWADAATPCATLEFSDLAIHPSVPRASESEFRAPMVAPLTTLFSVPTGYDFQDPACGGVHSVCWPTVAASGLEYYERGADGIPGWERVLLVSALKRGSVYVVPLDATGQRADGPVTRELQTENRYRDLALHPDGRTLFVATDANGITEALAGGTTTQLQDRGAILAFTYVGENADAPTTGAPVTAAPPRPGATPADPARPIVTGPVPAFTAAQAAAGKAAYASSCAVCHGTTLTNGTYGTPLAGEYFRRQWRGRPVADLLEKSRTTMPPASPASLPAEIHAAIVAYLLEVNGVPAGAVPLSADSMRQSDARIP